MTRFLALVLLMAGCSLSADVTPNLECTNECDDNQEVCYEECETECVNADGDLDEACDTDCHTVCDDEADSCTLTCTGA